MIRKVIYYIERLISLLKVFYLRSQGIYIENARNSYLHKNSQIVNNSKNRVKIGSIEVCSNACISSATEYSNLMIGRNVYVNRNTIIACRSQIVIGDDVIIGPNVLIHDHDHNYTSMGRKKLAEDKPFKEGKIEIGNNVWIAGGVSILRNSVIGDNTIIGAGVIVKGVIPPFSIVTQNRDLNIRKLEDR